MKRCWMCALDRPLDDFWPDRSGRHKDGRVSTCKVCARARAAAYRARAREVRTSRMTAAERRLYRCLLPDAHMHTSVARLRPQCAALVFARDLAEHMALHEADDGCSIDIAFARVE